MKSLDVDADGYIKQTAENRQIIQKARRAFNPNAIPEYKKGIGQYASSLSPMEKANLAYFDFLKSGVKANAQFNASLKAQTIKEIETLTLNKGLESNIVQPLLNILNQNINSSARFTDMLSQVTQYITGGDVDGQLLRYSKQITTDTLFNYSRAYQQAMASDLGLEHYEYSGGVTEGGKFSTGSRAFCLSRIGNVYTQKEVESWGAQSWEGQRRGTNASSIFIYCGGYNCRHSLIPVLAKEGAKAKAAEAAPKAFIPAKSLDEAKVQINEMFTSRGIALKEIRISKELTLNQVNARNAQLSKLLNEYRIPEYKGSNAIFSYQSTFGLNGEVRSFQDGSRVVSMNFGSRVNAGRVKSKIPFNYDQPNPLNNLSRQNSYVDLANLEISTQTHEFGHLMSIRGFKGHDPFWGEIKKVKSSYIRETKKLIQAKKYAEFDEIYMGDYAASQLDEFMAEAWTEYKLSSTPSKYAKTVGEIIDKYFKKG